MAGDRYILVALLVGFVITVTLRALPFLAIEPLRRSSMVRYLAVHMPAGVMVILTAYTLKDVPVSTWPFALPEIIGVAVTVGLHLWRRNPVLSIAVGTLTYVALASWVFSNGGLIA